MSIGKALAANPALVLRHRNIFLLSHMRANTSLFGHLLGSHPQIEGYYEMHIDYYSWKSLWRQKLRHFAGHAPKPQATYMFDKILHDGHHVDTSILQRASSRTIFMLREPEQSIKSLVALYRERNPHRPESTAEGAARYYIDRLRTLSGIASALGGRYFYLDAEALVERTDATLATLSTWLSLPTPIPSEYETFSLTGQRNSGDSSARLKSGRVQSGGRQYGEIALDPALLDEARERYDHVRRGLVSGSERQATWTRAELQSLRSSDPAHP
jgi:hypothetical protein